MPSAPCFLRFWGVRGSIPTPGPSTVRYGGNTSCIEVRADDEIVILDAGSGIRPLGLELEREFGDRPLNITLLISHTHWDHIQGFPYFLPAYRVDNRIRICGYEGTSRGLAATIAGQMDAPYFPVGMNEMRAGIQIEELRAMEFTIGKIYVRAFPAHHPGVAVGYRLYTSCGSVGYMPDNEPFGYQPKNGSKETSEEYTAEMRSRMVEFMRDVDIMILDAQYDREEYLKHIGWGHGCVDDVVDLAIDAGVKRLVLFHHDPEHADETVDCMLAHARSIVAIRGSQLVVDAAKEGGAIEFGGH